MKVMSDVEYQHAENEKHTTLMQTLYTVMVLYPRKTQQKLNGQTYFFNFFY